MLYSANIKLPKQFILTVLILSYHVICIIHEEILCLIILSPVTLQKEIIYRVYIFIVLIF